MRQENIGTKSLRVKMAVGYALILLLVGGIVHIWLGERQEMETLEAGNERVSDFRKEIHGLYVHIAELSLMGETILDWDDGDVEEYRKKRLEADSLLRRFKPIYDGRRIDSICHLLADKEEQLRRIMEVLDRQDTLNAQIAERVPVIAWKSTQEEPRKPKRKGFLGLFGKKEEPEPTATSAMLYTLNSDMIARRERQDRRLSEYADSLAARNTELNHRLQSMIGQMDARVQDSIGQREEEIAAMRGRAFRTAGGITGFVVLLLLLSYIIIHRATRRIHRYKHETTVLITKLQKALEINKSLLAARRKAMLTVIHELRTPLTAIHGYAELLPQAESEGKRAAYMENMRRSAGRMKEMLDTLLGFYRLDSGKEQEHAVPFRLQGVADALRGDFGPRAEAKGLALHVAGCGNHVLMGDRERLMQIGGNLLGNAVKFTEHGTVSLSLEYDGKRVTMAVSDTGTGMDKEQQERIFEAFERLPNAAVQDGFGLGLPIVRSIVSMLGGSVGVESEKGKGSRFTVVLPMPAADSIRPAESRKEALAARDSAPACSVLVIDNDDMTLAMTREMYGSKGIHCDTCTNTSDLMDALRARNYDLLVTDLRMPETNGYEVLELLRSSNVGNSRTIPVVVVTAAGNCDEKSLTDFGFTGCLFKPFSIKELMEATEKCVKPAGPGCKPDFSSLLAYGSKKEMLDTLAATTEKDMQAVEEAGSRNDRKALDEWVHHLRSSWAVIRADKPLWKLHALLHGKSECTDEEIGKAVKDVLEMGKRIVEQAKEERSKEDEGTCG